MGSYPRQTIRESIRLSGPGLMSGEPVEVVIHPGGPGIRIQQTSGSKLIRPDMVTSTNRCTALGDVAVVEHVLSALAGMGVTDCTIEVKGRELPAADGCSQPYVQAIDRVGLVPCGNLEVDDLFARIFLQEGSIKIAAGAGSGLWRYELFLSDYFVQQQNFAFAWSPDDYRSEVAPARTIVLEHEIEAAKAMGLGRGLTEESCLAVGHKEYLGSARFADEPARHKLLDLIGDLYLTGIPIQHMNVIAERSGHASNVAFANKLSQALTVHYQD